MSEAIQDPAIYDLSVELAAIAGRLVSLCAAKGLEVTRAQLVDGVLQAIEDDQTATPDGVASLAKARRARGLPALARPVDASHPVEQLAISFTFEGDRAREVGRMALQLHGETSEATCRAVVTAAAERGLSSLKRELGLD